jgi:hypothetical protein
MRTHILDSWHSKRSQRTGPPDADHGCSCHQLEGTHLQRPNMAGTEMPRL